MSKESKLTHEEVVSRVYNQKRSKQFKGMSFSEFIQSKKAKESRNQKQ